MKSYSSGLDDNPRTNTTGTGPDTADGFAKQYFYRAQVGERPLDGFVIGMRNIVPHQGPFVAVVTGASHNSWGPFGPVVAIRNMVFRASNGRPFSLRKHFVFAACPSKAGACSPHSQLAKPDCSLGMRFYSCN